MPHREPPETCHVVAAPAQSGRPGDVGRLSPLILLGHTLRVRARTNQRVVVVGPTGAADTARACGLEPTETITAPLGNPRMARPGLARRCRGAERIICWSDELAPLVRRMADDVRLVSTNPALCPLPPRHFARITTLTEHDTLAWRSRGASPVHAESWIRELRDTPLGGVCSLRDQLVIDPGSLVLAELSDRPTRTDARGMAFLLSVLHTTGFPVCGIVPAVASNAHAARRHIRGLASKYRFFLTDLAIPSILSGVDLVVIAEQADTGSSQILEAYARARGCAVTRLSHRGRAGLQSTPGVAVPVLDMLEQILTARGQAVPRAIEPIDA